MDYPLANPAHARILGIDPGSDTTGTAVIDFEIGPGWELGQPTLMYGDTLHGARAASNMEWCSAVAGARFARGKALRQGLLELLNATEPTFVVAETPFYKRRNISAYEALVETRVMLRNTLYTYSPTLVLHGIEPTTAKWFLGVDPKSKNAKGDNISKDLVRDALILIYKDRCADGVDITALDEHTWDALAVAHSWYLQTLRNQKLPPRPKTPKRSKRKGRG